VGAIFDYFWDWFPLGYLAPACKLNHQISAAPKRPQIKLKQKDNCAVVATGAVDKALNAAQTATW